MSWGYWGDQRWILIDRYGRTWRLAVGRPRAPTSFTPRAMGPAAVVEELVSDAFAPWGTATRETTTCLLQIYGALGGREVALEYLHRQRGETGWRHRLDTIRTALIRAVEIGELQCEPACRFRQGVWEETSSNLRLGARS